MVESHLTETFGLLKPACNRVIKDPSKENISYLRNLLSNVPPSNFRPMQDMMRFPLEVHLHNNMLGSEVKCCLVDCLKEMFDRSLFTNLNSVFKLYSLLFFQIYDSTNNNLIGNVPEELKLSIMRCVTSLLRCTSSDVLIEFYDKKHAPKIAQGIFISVQVAQREKLRPLRLAAIECVMVLCYVHDGADKDDVVLRSRVGDLLMFFLPGIVSALQNVVSEDEKQGHQIILNAVKAWGQIITLVMEDCNNPADTPDNFHWQYSLNKSSLETKEDPLSSTWHRDNNKEAMMKSIKEKTRTPEWYSAAAEKLAYSVKAVVEVQQNQHWKVRLELALACRFLLSRCCRNLKPCIMYLVETLISLSEDENEEVSQVSKQGLETFTEKFELEHGKSLLEMLEDNFYNLLTKLPRILHGTDDVKQLSALRLLAGYIKLLGPNKLPQVLISAAHLNRLLMTLIQAVELESAASILEDYSLRDIEANYVLGMSLPWKQFKNFTDNNILTKMIDICSTLGQFADLNTLVFHLLDMFHSNPLHCKEIILLLNQILLGGSSRSDVDLEFIVQTVLKTYLEPSVWYVSTIVDAESSEDQNFETSCSTLKEAHSNVIQVCLLVEGVGKMAQVLGCKFKKFLVDTLYLVLERAGSGHGLIAAAGMAAAQDIAFACGYGSSVSDLLQANTDYFCFHVMKKLHRIKENPGVLNVLTIALKVCKLDALPFLEQIVQDVLEQSYDSFHGTNTVSFLHVFYTFIVSVRQWLEIEDIDTDCQNKSIQQCASPFPNRLRHSKVVLDLLEYHECRMKSEDFSDMDVNDEVTEQLQNDTAGDETSMECDYNDIDDKAKKKNLPLHVKITVSILKRCVHFLPTKNREKKLLVLSILREGLLILEKWENELLPIVHAIWSPFVDRFSETSDPLVINRSFGLLCVLAWTAKDFIRARTLKNVLPSLCQFLSKTATESKKKDTGSSYRHTQLFKLQLQLLSNLGDLAINLKLGVRDIDRVLSAASPYLSSLQPEPLQNACVYLFLRLAVQNRDAVWMKVISMWSPSTVLTPTFENLPAIKLPEKALHGLEFRKCVEEILLIINAAAKE